MTDQNEHEKSAEVSGSRLEPVVIPEYSQGTCGDGAAILMDGKRLTVDEIVEALNINERLLHERQRVLDAVPPCPLHGKGCVPHAIEWIESKV